MAPPLYHVTTKCTPISHDLILMLNTDDSCNHRFTDTSGNFSSPNFPRNYPKLANCTYYFSIPEATSINFYPNMFSVHASDAVYIGNQSDVDLSASNVYTRTEFPFFVNIRGDFAWVHFTSDVDISDMGFSLNWEAVLRTY